MEENIMVIRVPKNCHFDRLKDVDANLKQEIEFIIKSNESLAENKIKNKTEQLFLKYKHGNNIHEYEHSKTNEPHKFVLNFSQRRFK